MQSHDNTRWWEMVQNRQSWRIAERSTYILLIVSFVRYIVRGQGWDTKKKRKNFRMYID